MSYTTALILTIVCGSLLVFMIWSNLTNQAGKAVLDVIKDNIPDFEHSTVLSLSGMPVFVIDKNIEILYVCIYSFALGKHSPLYQSLKERKIKDILKCEISNDSKIIYTVNRGSQVLGTLVGGAVLGPAGAIIGGATASKTGKSQNEGYEIKIYYDDIKDPIDIIKGAVGTTEEEILKCHATIEACVHRVQNGATANTDSGEQNA